MFPVTLTLTINNAEQLNKISALFSGTAVAPKAEKAVKETVSAPKAQPAAEASTKSTQASPTTQPAAAQAASEGNAAAEASTPASPAASTASSSEASASPEVSFEQLKKAFLALSTKDGGRAKCEGVLKPHGLAKLSEAKESQYAAILAAINEASA